MNPNKISKFKSWIHLKIIYLLYKNKIVKKGKYFFTPESLIDSSAYNTASVRESTAEHSIRFSTFALNFIYIIKWK